MTVIHLPELSETTTNSIVSQQLSGLLKAHCCEFNGREIQTLLEASLELYGTVKETLHVCDHPGRQHYFFSVKQLVSVFQVSTDVLIKYKCSELAVCISIR